MSARPGEALRILLALAASAASLMLGSAIPARGATPTTSTVTDSTVILRVGNRVTTAFDFVQQYYGAWAEDRPATPDSSGRREFLKQVTDKEVLATVALKNPRPLDFGDRLVMRQHTERVLSNVLYQRAVLDSTAPTKAQVEALRKNYALEKHLKRILFPGLVEANQARQALLQKKLTWDEAKRQALRTMPDSTGGDLGWVQRAKLNTVDATEIFDIAPGEISQPHEEPLGFSLVHVVEQRPIMRPSFAQYDQILKAEVTATSKARRMNDLQRDLGLRVKLSFDEPNLVWASSRFSNPNPNPETGELVIGVGKVPTFAPQDTGRVLARWQGGQMTIRGFMDEYMRAHPYLRTPVNTPGALRQKVRTFALEPYRAQLAVARGLDKDPLAVRMIEHKREAILVEHLYQDSIQSQVKTTEAQERKYYQDNIARFITYPVVHFAGFSRPSKKSADSLVARLRAGMRVEDAMAADSIRFGKATGFYSQYNTQDDGRPFYKMLMEELKPGQVGTELTDKGWWVLKVLSFDPGRQLSFEEARLPVQESVSNMMAQDLLDRFLARHKRGLEIEAHPELLQQIDFTDPIARR